MIRIICSVFEVDLDTFTDWKSNIHKKKRLECALDFLDSFQRDVIGLSRYNLDLALSDLYLFRHLKLQLGDNRFDNKE